MEMYYPSFLQNLCQLGCLVLIWGCTCASADWTCPLWSGNEGFIRLHEQMCFFRSDFKKDWVTAESYCKKHGGILAKERSKDITEFFKRQLLVKSDGKSETSCFWIGLTDNGQPDKWRWSDGTKPVYTNWQHVSLSVGWISSWLLKDQMCVNVCVISRDGDSLADWSWNSISCTDKVRFICQTEAVRMDVQTTASATHVDREDIQTTIPVSHEITVKNWSSVSAVRENRQSMDELVRTKPKRGKQTERKRSNSADQSKSDIY